MSGPVYNEASKVAAEDGEVVVDGPDGVAVSLTPEAAAETSDRLMQGAVEASGQRVRRHRLDDSQGSARSDR